MRAELFMTTCLSLAMTGTCAAQTFEIIRLSHDQNQITGALDVSGDGQTAVGWVGPDYWIHGMRWDQHLGMGPLDPNQKVSGANYPIYAASHDASVVVGAALANDVGTIPFIHSQTAGLTVLGDLSDGQQSGSAEDVSADGDIVVGWSIGQKGREAFRWTAHDGMVGLGAIPGGFFGDVSSEASAISADGSKIVGASSSEEFISEPCRWNEDGSLERLGVLPGASLAGGRAWGVNADGTVVVGNSSSSSGTHAFRWTPLSGMEDLGALPGGIRFATAFATNADGSIVVGKSGSSRVTPVANGEAILWTRRDGTRSLMQILEQDYQIDLQGFHLESANAISADGSVIVGTGVNENGTCQGWVVILPKAFRPLTTTRAKGR